MTERKVTLIGQPWAVVPEDWRLAARLDQLQGDSCDQIVEMGGRVAYDSFGKGRSSEDFHKHLQASGHVNPTYHAVFVFRIEGYSRSMTKELNRHHVGCSPSERSGRFVDESETPWTRHPVLEKYLEEKAGGEDHDVLLATSAAIFAGRRAYETVVTRIQPWLEAHGVDKSTARKQARAAARQYLGNGLETEQVWSANIAAIRNVIRQRGGLGADAEIRDFAVRLTRLMQNACPTYFSDAVFEDHGVLGTSVALTGVEEEET